MTHPEIIEFNIEGETCPYPLILTIRKVEEIKPGLDSGKQLLEVITDCLSASYNIPLEFRKRGYQVGVKKIDKTKWRIIIQKSSKTSVFKAHPLNLTRLTMGIIILIGIFFFKPLVYLAGAMMIFAGLTGICLLEIFYNKLLGVGCGSCEKQKEKEEKRSN